MAPEDRARAELRGDAAVVVLVDRVANVEATVSPSAGGELVSLSCAGADRMSTGMRGAFGKPYGLVARVDIGQVIMSVRSKDTFRDGVITALRKAMFKFPGRQKVLLSRKWGFTPYSREEFQQRLDNGTLVTDGCYVQYKGTHGKLPKVASVEY